jgi:hypothetical protein
MMGSQSQHSADQPPVPGGDPDQAPDDLPVPPAGKNQGDKRKKDKNGYGHIGNKEVPRPDGAPLPHQIF